MSFLRVRDLIRARLKRSDSFEPNREITLGKVVAVNGSIYPAAPGLIWVNLWGDEGSPTQVFAAGFAVLAGDWVKISKNPKDPFRWSIIELWVGDIEPEYLGRVTRHDVGIHGLNHQMPTEATLGVDPVRIYQPALQLLKTTGNGSDLTVTVQTLLYTRGGVRRSYGGGTIDLTSSVPGAGNIRAVLIYLDTASNLAKALEGTEVTDDDVTPIPRPSLPSNGRFSAHVILSNGQTTITTVDDVEDARDFLTGDDSTLSGSTAEGQVLMSNEALQPIWATPVISQDDAWMVGDDDLLVIV